MKEHGLVFIVFIAVILSFTLGWMIATPNTEFNSVETQVNNKRRSDSLRIIIEFNEKLIKAYDK